MTTPNDQAWFWSKKWQAGEKLADEQIAKSVVTTCETEEEIDNFFNEILEHKAK